MSRKHGRSTLSDDTAACNPKRQKLTNVQLERKRELDRVAQKTAREKTRKHILHLENLVQTLQADNESNEKIGKLVAQLDEKNAEINRLRNALNSILKITNAACDTSVTNSTASSTSEEQGEPDKVAINTPANEERHNSVSGQEDYPSPAFEVTSVCSNYTQTIFSQPHDKVQDSTARELSTSHLPTTSPLREVVIDSAENAQLAGAPDIPDFDRNDALSISQMASSITRNTKLEGRFWYLAGTLLNHILKRPQQLLYSAAFDEDIAIRAVIEGWSAVMERYPLDRGWQWLKELDETIYFNSGVPERLTHLRNCRLQFLRQMFPEADCSQMLPAFFTARPSQRYLDFDPLIEHFPWPTLRERLLFFPRKYATNKFMETLRHNLHFIWGYEPNELYVKDSCTGVYSYSEAFLRHMMDIRCYSVKPAFFDHFPELREDIPFNDPSPFNIISTYVSTANAMITPASEGCIHDIETVFGED